MRADKQTCTALPCLLSVEHLTRSSFCVTRLLASLMRVSLSCAFNSTCDSLATRAFSALDCLSAIRCSSISRSGKRLLCRRLGEEMPADRGTSQLGNKISAPPLVVFIGGCQDSDNFSNFAVCRRNISRKDSQCARPELASHAS